MSWHADGSVLGAYARRQLDFAASASVEAHLLACEQCRSELARQLPPELALRTRAAWGGIRERVEPPRMPWAVLLLRRLGVSEETAVVLAAARSMSTAWTLATVVVLGFAGLAVLTGSDAGRALYLVIAPLVPVAGVVAAFGPGGDRLGELTRTTPYPPPRLVLVRSAGVAFTSVPLALLVGLLVPGQEWLAVAWLAPALALILLTLSASTWVDPFVAGGVAALGWSSVVAAAARVGAAADAVSGGTQVGYLGAALLAGVVLIHRTRGSRLPGGAT